MESKNDAEQIRVTTVTGALANVAMPLVSKSVSFTLSDGATDFNLGDKFTLAITKNPPAAGSVTAASGNIGDGTAGAVTLVGDWPEETITFTCTAEATDGGTFSARGSKTGNLGALTVGAAWTQVLEQMEVGDQIIAALALTAAGAATTNIALSTLYTYSGGIKSTADISTSAAGGLVVFWRKRSAG